MIFYINVEKVDNFPVRGRKNFGCLIIAENRLFANGFTCLIFKNAFTNKITIDKLLTCGFRIIH